ncbi:MAG: DEAD/DEAH box helicase [Phycisphaerales bacterium]
MTQTTTFQDLGLAEPIATVLAKRNYTTPTPIQALAIPAILEGRDVFGCAQTGTGKTAAFALPILHDLFEAGHDGGPRRTHNGKKELRGKRARPPRALVLCPTRELAVQIFDSFVAYGRNVPLRHAAVFGGVSQFRQEKALKAGVDVLIATPGRLMDLHQQGLIDLSEIEVLVLDEADRMLDMGFLPDMKRIAALTPDARQTLLFSATASKAIKALANGLLTEPVHLETTPESTTVERINQQAYVVEKTNKPRLLRALLSREHVGRTLVFTRTKHGADRVVKQLEREGVRASAIHGNKTQNARTRALTAFKNDAQGVLIATDVASRGIDVSGITHVINFDLPADAETYVHRVGRTARAGASGIAITFAEQAEARDLADIQRRTKADIQPGDELPEDLAHIAEPYQPRPQRADRTAEPKPSGRRKPGPRRGPAPSAARRGKPGHRQGGQKPGGRTQKSGGPRKPANAR